MTTLTSTKLPVSEALLDKVNTSLQRARTCIKSSTEELRRAYQQDESILRAETTKYRRLLYSEGMMYGTHVYPRSVKLVQLVKDTLEYYVLLDYDDFGECIDDIRKECLNHSKRATEIQIAHTYVLSNLKRLDNEMRVMVDTLKGQGAHHRRKAESRTERSEAAKVGGVLAVAGSALLIPFDAGVTFATTLGTVGGVAGLLGSHWEDKAIAAKMSADAAEKNAAIIHRLTDSVQDLCEAVELVASFVTMMADELEGLSRIGVDDHFKKIHWIKMTRKSNNLVESCKAFIAVEPAISSDLLSIKESLEVGYKAKWEESLKSYRPDSSIKVIEG
jgi:hypothetical protein